jgi:exodeoxyribonuclease V beta subunit
MSEIELPTMRTIEDWRALALDPGGRSLIEASAGTGKTWTIAVLYLRLLLERELSPRQIVVSTFTEAASQELRERIRLRVHEAMRWSALAASGQSFDGCDPALEWLRERWRAANSTPGSDVTRLQLALAELDSAPIGTLHSLCQRILREFPFETGSQFVQGELVAGEGLVAECARDLLRGMNVADGTAVEMPTVAALADQLRVLLRPGVSVPDIHPASIRASLPGDAAERIEAFASDTSIYTRTNGGKPQRTLHGALLELASWCRNADAKLTQQNPKHLKERERNLLPEALEHLQNGPELKLVTQVLAAYQAVEHAAESRLWAERQSRALQMCEQRLAARNQLTFDSLITRANAAIKRNPVLAERLFEAWPVALIDEFQDTDALQYGVLDSIYRNADGGIHGRLVMIGDPKQAIYSFRGGDIDAYRLAAGSVSDRLTLKTNRRSDPRLVQAFNQFYALAGLELSTQSPHDIRYHDVEWVDPTHHYTVDDAPCEQPLLLHYLSECPDNAPERRGLALTACANQITQMLADGNHRIDGVPLRPGHIAVLLPSHRDVAALRERLVALGVPCVGAGRSNVFTGEWAEELQLLLHAVQHPHSATATHAALATRLVGWDFAGLQHLRDDPAKSAQCTHWFEMLRDLWGQAGVLAVVRTVLSDAAGRLLLCDDGERAMTDLRHLGELLQEADERMHGPEQLLAWLAAQRSEAATSPDTEESQLRMESDARRVRLMTLHASKGLEFPIVYLPLMWAHVGWDETALLPDGKGGRIVAFGDEARRPHQQAGQDERFRVLYVALTRAMHACHVYVLPSCRNKAANTDKPAVDPERSALDATVERLMQASENGLALLDGASPLRWSEGWPWTAPAQLAVAEQDESSRQARCMPKKVLVLERLHSFSSLSQGRYSGHEEAPADDEGVELAMDAHAVEPTPGMPAATSTTVVHDDSPKAEAVLKQLAWIRGAEFGNALHQVFEQRRIGVPIAHQLGLIDSALRQHGVRLGDVPRADAIARIGLRVQDALDADLGGGLKLGTLPARALRAEMGFHYPLDGVQVSNLRRVCAAHGVVVPQNAASRLFGLMHGKIDLVFEHGGRFHVLDYKGNQLGDRDSGGVLADYARPALNIVMRHHHYDLQALLYTVALERLLRQRVANYRRDDHLGDAIYLFVRAAGLAPGAGVWRHRFDDDLLDAVDGVLGGIAAREEDTQILEEVDA